MVIGGKTHIHRRKEMSGRKIDEFNNCIIDEEWDEEWDDEEELGPYDSPKASTRHEKRINSRMRQRLAKYKETGEFDDRD
jgi:hypothetical protein